MATFTVDTHVDGSVEAIWEVLADIGSIGAWNPGVVDSRVTSDLSEGVGSSRRCELGGKNFLDEEVVV